MIYLENIQEAQQMLIPDNGLPTAGTLKVCIFSPMDNRHLADMEVLDLGVTRGYYDVSVVLPEGLANGEYHYELSDGATLSSGVLVIGGYKAQNRQYNENKTYKQYE